MSLSLSGAKSVLCVLVATVSYTISNVAQIYWLNGSSMSLYGQFIFFLLFLAAICWLQLAAYAFYTRDPAALLPSHDPAQRRFFCCTLCPRASRAPPPPPLPPRSLNGGGEAAEPLLLASPLPEEAPPAPPAAPRPTFTPAAFSRLSDAELLFCLGLNNGLAALLQWYATPPTREPPLLNSIVPALSVAFAIPLSKLLLADARVFLAPAPLLALAAIVGGLAVGLLPSALAGTALAGAESAPNVLAWTLVNVASQLPSAGALVGVQALLMRAGTGKGAQALAVMRFLAYNQVGCAVLMVGCFWADFLPWFGTPGSSPAALGAGVAGAFRCSLLGPAGGDPGCSPLAPLWALLGVAPYMLYLGAMAVVSGESAVFGNAVGVLQAVMQTLFFLIPGTNPDAAATPVWSTLASVALSVGGVVAYKRWELREEAEAGGGEVRFRGEGKVVLLPRVELRQQG